MHSFYNFVANLIINSRLQVWISVYFRGKFANDEIHEVF